MKVLLLFLILLLYPTLAIAQSQRYDRVFVLPAREKLTLDGDLKEWDLSGAIECFYDEALRHKFTMRIALMYDAEAFYVGAHFVDDTPLLNRHDPHVEPNVGWAGDCLQLRLCSDPDAPYPLPNSNSDAICHLTMWYFTDREMPVLHIQYGMDYHGTRIFTGGDSGIAFAKDGGGYTLEARIPWKQLNAPRQLKPGDAIALTVQPLWSDGSGWKQAINFNDIIRQTGFSFQDSSMWGQAVFSERGNLAQQERSRTVEEKLQPLMLKLPALDAESKSLSVAIANAEGVLVRTLPVLRATGNEELPSSIRWDGLDDDGKPLPEGDYVVRTLTHRGVDQKYVTSLHSAGTPPWRTDDGRGAWGGDHGSPLAAASDNERVYLGWDISEAGWAIIAVEPEVRSKNIAQKIWGQHQILEIGMGIMAIAVHQERLFVAQDGKSWGAREDKDALSVAGVVLWDAKSGRPVNFPFGKRYLVVSEWSSKDKAGQNLRGIAVSGDQLFASLHHEDKIAVFNWRTGEKITEFPAPEPGGVEVDDNGMLYAVSDKQVIRIDPKSGSVQSLITEGLSEPYDLALKDGKIYVTDRGEDMQVKVFQGGKLISRIGKTGGRPALGKYDETGIYNPAALSIDHEGKIWVTEYDNIPKRVSVWTQTGDLVADLLGPGAYAVDGSADPARPEWINTHDTLFEIDYETGVSRTLATLVRTEEGQIGGRDFMGRSLFFRHAEGNDYLIRRGHHLTIVYRLDADLIGRPVSAAGWLKDAWLYGVTREHVGEEAYSNTFAYGFCWADTNGDTRMQSEEFVAEKTKLTHWGSYWGEYVDENLAIWSSNREAKAVWRIPVKEFSANGVPIYPRPSEQEPLFILEDTANIHYVMPGKDNVYILEDLPGRGGAISCCTLDGERLWSYRRVWTGFGLDSSLSQPGDVCGAMKFIGSVELNSGMELVAVNNYFGYFSVLSQNGLWVDMLCKDNRYGPKADEKTVWPENFSGYFYRNHENGKIYLMAGDTDTRIWEITGLETIQTGEDRFLISPADREKSEYAAMTRQGIPVEKEPITLSRIDNVHIDGRIDEWNPELAVHIDAGGGREAKAAMAYDDQNLYVMFDVADDSPMQNSGADFALLFKTGDSCNVMLAADPDAPSDRTRPVKGDLRILFSVLDGRPVAVLYEPVMRSGERRNRVFSSPTGTLSFDRVTVLENAKLAVDRKSDGYILEAAVPLKDMGFLPVPGSFTRGDLGVIFSDPGGSRNVLRVYYANKDTAIVNDIPSEARLEPQKWGAIGIE